MNSTGSGCHNLRSRGSSGVSWSASENQSVLQEQMSLNSNDAHYTQQPAYYPEVPRRYDSTSSSIISAPHDSQQSSSSGYAVLPTLFQSPKGASSKKLKTMSGEQRSRCIQMNSCFVCNMAFVTKKVGSLEDGVKRFQNLCSMLQVPTYEEFLPETNPLCTKCCEGIEEFFKLQRQIQGLINMLGELRKMLGKRLVDTHNVTATCRKNYNIKSKIYEIWSHRVKTSDSQPTVTDLEDNFASIITSLNSGNTFQPPHEQPEAETAYSLLDISNSVSSKADSLANSVAGNCNDDSQDCPSPAASVDDGGDSDYGVEAEDDMVYRKNLNDNDDETPSAKPVEEDNSQWRGGSQSTAPSTNMNFGTFNVIPTETLGSTQSDDFKSSAQKSTKNEAVGIDGRKQRPIVVTKRRTHPCKFCGHLFPSNFALEMHERTHTGT
ncbi:hypothetical protein Ocin01_09888 [Orchesella cincta]|uniref:C2H2-type domain-containing protein n=1 Tax=Orchesella cincta TaxID=48709 RepID=A0A1D2MVU3_ORCCI|nr:hypothetical protein Ocin01_09888 [Orchesella cincta]